MSRKLHTFHHLIFFFLNNQNARVRESRIIFDIGRSINQQIEMPESIIRFFNFKFAYTFHKVVRQQHLVAFCTSQGLDDVSPLLRMLFPFYFWLRQQKLVETRSERTEALGLFVIMLLCLRYCCGLTCCLFRCWSKQILIL